MPGRTPKYKRMGNTLPLVRVVERRRRLKRGTPDHWKMKDLARRLRIPPMYAISWANGCMERIWHYASRYCLQGDIGRVPDAEIAEVVGWPVKSADRLVDALVEARWLDRCSTHRLLIHDWPDHCDDAVKKTLKNRGLEFFFPESSGNVPEFSGLARTEALAEPSQSLSRAKPEPTDGIDQPGILAQKMEVPVRRVPSPVVETAPLEEFAVWWQIWGAVRGTNREGPARSAWMSVVTTQLAPACFECTNSYLASLENPAKGYNPDNFLFEQAKQEFRARFPPYRPADADRHTIARNKVVDAAIIWGEK